ncbi:Myotubularin-like protein, partial [Globisporangium splendens]
MDTTFGVFLNWAFLEGFSMIARRFQWTSVMVPGDYGNPIRVRIWLAQLISWIVIIFLTKLVIAVFIVALEKPLGQLAMWVFTPLQPYPRLELALVMIACPCLMNALQFWIQDSFLKKDIRDECELVASTAKSSSSGPLDSTKSSKSRVTEPSSSDEESEKKGAASKALEFDEVAV